MKPTLVIFAKAPVPRQVKTRLIPAVGAEKAAVIYQCMAQRTYAEASRLKGVRVRVAYAPAKGHLTPGWMGARIVSFKQKGRDLGARLRQASGRAFRQGLGPVVIIGTDCPGLTTRHLRQAFAALKRKSVALGPTTDGGYYLIGLAKDAPILFKRIHWSTPVVFRQTLARATAGGLSVARLPRLRDLDTPADWRRLSGADRKRCMKGNL